MVNIFNRVGCRIFQGFMKIYVKSVRWKSQQTISFPEARMEIASLVESRGIESVLFVTGPHVVKIPEVQNIIESLKESSVSCKVFCDVSSEASDESIERAYKCYIEGECSGIIAVGGGSVMDSGKAVAAMAARRGRSVEKLIGHMKVRKKIPFLMAVPTTAGSGSEATGCAVIKVGGEKKIIVDPVILPDCAVLDPVLTLGLRAQMTAYSGMDAMAHAIEAYLGGLNTRQTRFDAEWALKLIFENLQDAYGAGEDITARDNMLNGSYFAGKAFTRAYVGYIHAIAHAVGSMYDVPHGCAVAVVMPYVLQWYGKSAWNRLARIAEIAGVGQPGMSAKMRSGMLIEKIKYMNEKMGIPKSFEGINESDAKTIAERAIKEANPFYPVPKLMSVDECTKLVLSMRS